jgi:zinc transport system permease protein
MRAIAMPDFLWHAIVGAGLLGAACGPAGAFVLWRRMAYLGESVAHMGILGAAIGLLMGVAPIAGVGVLCLFAALIMARADDGRIPGGTFVGIVGHAGLALGFILLATMETVRADLLGYLFGDVLALSGSDIAMIAAASLAALAAMALIWRPLLADTVNHDIAVAEGLSRRYANAVFVVVVALLVAFGLRVVGALLIIALLIIPAAAARLLSRTPETMALTAAAIGIAAAPLGIAGSWWSDAPAGPSIVLAATALFALAAAGGAFLENRP